MNSKYMAATMLVAVAGSIANAGTIDFSNPDLSAWTPDRFRPAIFETNTTRFAGNAVLKHGVRSADNQAARNDLDPFHNNYQGMQIDVDSGANAIGIDIFVDSLWTSGTRAGMWGVMNDGLGNSNSLTFPILEYVVNGDNGDMAGPTFTGFRYWDSSFGWRGLAGTVGTDAWYTLGIELTATDVIFSINGADVATPLHRYAVEDL